MDNKTTEMAVETVTEVADQMVESTEILGPTVFQTSNNAKIVCGVVLAAGATYLMIKGVKFVKDKFGKKKVVDEITEDEETDITDQEVEDDFEEE